ncbi:MAG: PilZ domain-containing protein [Magnetococcales bacterium]|nr:PilZ domain-containing protein [Magnetococcales bacterium]
MAEKKTFENQSEPVTFWFRRITPTYLARIRGCHKKGAPIPRARPEFAPDIVELLAKKPRGSTAISGRGSKGADRVAALEAIDRKFAFLLETVFPPEVVIPRVPVMLDPEGRGVVAWIKDPPFAENDILELMFLAGPALPWSFHGFGRVVRMRQDWSNRGQRVEFRFEMVVGGLKTALLPEPSAKPRIIEKPPARREIIPTPAPSEKISSPIPPVRPPVRPTPEPAPAVTKNTSVRKSPEPKPAPAAKLPPPAPKSADKYDRMLQEGMKLSQATVEDAVIRKGDDPFIAAQPRADQRRDFRINDRIPFVWCHVSDTAFAEAMTHFHRDKAFGLRGIIRNQQKILADLGAIQDFLKRKHSKARKHVDWHRERLSWLFLRATSENEESYYQAMTELFTSIARDLSQQSGALGQSSNQALSLFRDLMELQQIRDQSNPITDVNPLKKALDGINDIERQLPKILQKIGESSPPLAARMNTYLETIKSIDLSQHDRPVGKSPDGKDLYTVNLSATGLAFRTRRMWVKKGDLLEMRIFLSIGGDRFVPVTTYGRVVFVNGPVDNRLKVATHIDPKPAEFEKMIYQHIARRQREILADRAAMKEVDEEDF